MKTLCKSMTYFLLSFILFFSACEKEASLIQPDPAVQDEPPCIEEVFFGDPLPAVKIKCSRFEESFYKNETQKTQKVTLQATDNCEDFDSKVYLRNDEKDELEMEVPDGGTINRTFEVKAGYYLDFDCSGSGSGHCSYTIVVH